MTKCEESWFMMLRLTVEYWNVLSTPTPNLKCIFATALQFLLLQTKYKQYWGINIATIFSCSVLVTTTRLGKILIILIKKGFGTAWLMQIYWIFWLVFYQKRSYLQNDSRQMRLKRWKARLQSFSLALMNLTVMIGKLVLVITCILLSTRLVVESRKCILLSYALSNYIFSDCRNQCLLPWPW